MILDATRNRLFTCRQTSLSIGIATLPNDPFTKQDTMSTAAAPIRLLIVDDHEIVRAGLRALFAQANGIEVIADVASA